MTDKALENAERKRDSLAAEIKSLAQRMEELKRDIAVLDDWISRWHEFAGKDAAAVAPESHEHALPAAHSARTKGNPSKEDVAAKVKELILKRGAPIPRNDLFEVLESGGIIIRGADPKKVVLGTMLWRTEDIIRLRGHGYWLKDRSFAPAGYNPKRPIEDTMSEHAKGVFEDILT